MSNSLIELHADGVMPAYVAKPDAKPRGCVIVIQEIFGISQPMKNAADLLAAEGYLAIVPAMFHRVDPNFTAEYDDAGKQAGVAAMMKTTIADVTADLSACAAYLHEQAGDDIKIGVWGFCFGGSMAYLAATLPFVDASVSFYGGAIAASYIPGMPPLIELTEQIRVPMLLAFGALDAGIPVESVERIRAELTEAGKTFDLQLYPDADHGFFRPGPTSSSAAADVWTRVKAFLADNVAHDA
jgi:carboxymethylenebutenolidase